MKLYYVVYRLGLQYVLLAYNNLFIKIAESTIKRNYRGNVTTDGSSIKYLREREKTLINFIKNKLVTDKFVTVLSTIGLTSALLVHGSCRLADVYQY